MTKKHFNSMAAEFRAEFEHVAASWPKEEQVAGFRALNNAVGAFCRVAVRSNPHFDSSRFVRACGVRDN